MLTSMLTHILTFVDINIILLYMMVFPVVPVLLEVHVQTYPHCSKGKICSHLPSFSLSLSLSHTHTHTHTHTDGHRDQHTHIHRHTHTHTFTHSHTHTHIHTNMPQTVRNVTARVCVFVG